VEDSTYRSFGVWTCPGFTCNGTNLAFRVGKDPEVCHNCHNAVYSAIRNIIFEEFKVRYGIPDDVLFDDDLFQAFNLELAKRMAVKN